MKLESERMRRIEDLCVLCGNYLRGRSRRRVLDGRSNVVGMLSVEPQGRGISFAV